jgi:hypothetical protein
MKWLALPFRLQLLVYSSFLHMFSWGLQSSDFSRASNSFAPPLLVDTEWKLQLDIGLEPGTWMPKRYPGWAESGARLGLSVSIQFAKAQSTTAESLVGPLMETYQLIVTSPQATFVSVDGQQTVDFNWIGGWCIQRPEATVRNAQGSLVKPEGLLRFWLDCQSGAKRQDVEIPPGTRIFFTTGLWESPSVVKTQEKEYETLLKEIKELAEQAKKKKEQAKDQNILQYLGTLRDLVGFSQQYDILTARRDAYERALPPLNSPKAENGVIMAPNGSLVIKGNSDWMPGEEFLILGTFTTAAVIRRAEAS